MMPQFHSAIVGAVDRVCAERVEEFLDWASDALTGRVPERHIPSVIPVLAAKLLAATSVASLPPTMSTAEAKTVMDELIKSLSMEVDAILDLRARSTE